MITINNIKCLCRDFGWNPADARKFKLAWELLKLTRLDDDIIFHYLNENI